MPTSIIEGGAKFQLGDSENKHVIFPHTPPLLSKFLEFCPWTPWLWSQIKNIWTKALFVFWDAYFEAKGFELRI